MADEQKFDELSDNQQSALLQIAEIGRERSELVTELNRLRAQQETITARVQAISGRLDNLKHMHNEASFAYEQRAVIVARTRERAKRIEGLKELQPFAKPQTWEEGGETK
jgi:FtsZ-binding cell division protein ZapB